MIIIDPSNSGIEEFLLEKFERFKESLALSFFNDLKNHGVDDHLKSVYGDGLQEKPEDGYDVTIAVDLEKLDGNEKDLATSISQLKMQCFAGLFHTFFEHQAKGNNNEKAVIHLREDETLTRFNDSADLVLSKTFLQEFTEARRKITTSPQVIYSQKNPPVELEGTNAITGENVAHITYILLPRHFEPKSRENCVNLIHNFRNYLHYHIKCSKAYLQMRMRAKTMEFLKVLNRAIKEEPKQTVVRVNLQGAEVEKAADIALAYGSTSAAAARA